MSSTENDSRSYTDRIAPKLIDRPADLAEVAEALAELGPMTAKDLAVQYLDQNLAQGEDFDAAVKAFTPQCRYYADSR